MSPENLDPGDDDRGTPDHRVERLQRLFPAEPLDPLYEEFEIGLRRVVDRGGGDRYAMVDEQFRSPPHVLFLRTNKDHRYATALPRSAARIEDLRFEKRPAR